ncbi:hypothetical protein PUN28_015507 [Cardiocondyla obscurior]|uniref:Uncharacterized protein n=1 Tax=Cardiocondyla obscurior TaxID=286306 RepID=A0AAW2EVY4_9HYME
MRYSKCDLPVNKSRVSRFYASYCPARTYGVQQLKRQRHYARSSDPREAIFRAFRGTLLIDKSRAGMEAYRFPSSRADFTYVYPHALYSRCNNAIRIFLAFVL